LYAVHSTGSVAASEAPNMVGHVFLGKYTVTRLLDEGGMSKVYLARQTGPNRDVVVKVLKESLRAAPKARAHFRREIHIMSRFRRPHAVAYYDADPDDRHGPALVMEYLRGVDLHLLGRRQGRFTPERAGRLLAQLCDVLQAAHDAGVVHRDLKPGNLMILHPGTPVGAPKPPPKESGLFRLIDRTRQATAAPPASELEVQVERRDPGQASRLTITLVLRPGAGGVTAEWRSRCTQISRDFQAYLMGR
jgi:serine/threonine-protein kinase